MSLSQRGRSNIALLVAGLMVIGCGEDVTGPGPVATVAVTPAVLDTLIGIGATVQFSASAKDANGTVTNGTFTWSSDNSTAATVDATGLVTVVANGSATITATESGGIKGTAQFTSATVSAVPFMSMNYSVSATGAHHPMGLTSDGTAYYTINDGTAPSPLTQFNLSGTPQGAVDVNEDARGVLYNAANATFYIKNFGTDWYTVNPQTGAIAVALSGIFGSSQTSPALSPDGNSIYEYISSTGTVHVLDGTTGAETGTITGLQGTSQSIATDGPHLFTSSGTTIYMYDLSGREITTFTVANGNYSYALSYANGYLWTSDDLATGATSGTWYGYTVTQQ